MFQIQILHHHLGLWKSFWLYCFPSWLFWCGSYLRKYGPNPLTSWKYIQKSFRFLPDHLPLIRKFTSASALLKTCQWRRKFPPGYKRLQFETFAFHASNSISTWMNHNLITRIPSFQKFKQQIQNLKTFVVNDSVMSEKKAYIAWNKFMETMMGFSRFIWSLGSSMAKLFWVSFAQIFVRAFTSWSFREPRRIFSRY